MATIFTKIIKGEIPCYKIAENDDFIAFLDISPLMEGHTLVVPKMETDYIFNNPDELLARMLPFCKMVAMKIEKTISCQRIGIAVIGLEVPHTHIHLVPINSADDLNFTRPKLKLTAEELSATASRISKA